MNVYSQTAADLMTASIITIPPEESLRTAATLMNEHGIHCLIVDASAQGRSPGIITCKDIVQLLGDVDTSVFETIKVEEAMTSPVLSVQSDMCIADCVRMMRMSGIRRALVQRGSVAVGLLSFTDILRAAARTA